MKYEIKSIKIWSVIKIGFFIWGLLGFISGLYIAVMAPVLLQLMDSMGGFAGASAGFGAIGFILFPIVYGILGSVFGTVLTVVLAGFYNLLASLFGGLELNLKEEQLKPLNLQFPDSPPSIQDAPAESKSTEL